MGCRSRAGYVILQLIPSMKKACWEGSREEEGAAVCVVEYSKGYRIRAGCVIIRHAYYDEDGWIRGIKNGLDLG